LKLQADEHWKTQSQRPSRTRRAPVPPHLLPEFRPRPLQSQPPRPTVSATVTDSQPLVSSRDHVTRVSSATRVWGVLCGPRTWSRASQVRSSACCTGRRQCATPTARCTARSWSTLRTSMIVVKSSRTRIRPTSRTAWACVQPLSIQQRRRVLMAATATSAIGP
jgi:hypothetical protein